jgi:hypothetical protein
LLLLLLLLLNSVASFVVDHVVPKRTTAAIAGDVDPVVH